MSSPHGKCSVQGERGPPAKYTEPKPEQEMQRALSVAVNTEEHKMVFYTGLYTTQIELNEDLVATILLVPGKGKLFMDIATCFLCNE